MACLNPSKESPASGPGTTQGPSADRWRPAIAELLKLGARRRYDEARDLIERLTSIGQEPLPSELQACITLLRWSEQSFQGRYSPGLSGAIEAVSRLQDVGYGTELAWALSSVGFGMALVGDIESGLQWADLSIAQARAQGDPETLCRCLGNRGVTFSLAMDRQGALQAYDEALAICPPDAWMMRSSALNNIAYVHLVMSQQAEAGSAQRHDHAQSALSAALQARSGLDAVEHQRWWTWSMSNEAGALAMRGRHREAEAVFRAGLQLAAVNTRMELVMLANFGRLLAETNRHGEAQEVLERAHRQAVQGEQADLLDPTLDLILDHLRLNERLAGRQACAFEWAEQRIGRLEAQHAARLEAVRRHVALFARLDRERRAEREQAQAQVRFWQSEAHRDPLTGVLNRRGLEEAAESLPRDGRPRAVFVIDFDHFKSINDRFGHDVGDQVLRSGAALMQAGIRGHDHLARLGGEEFCVVLEACGVDDARRVCEKLRLAVQAHDWQVMAPGLRVTLSAGIAVGRATDDLPSLILRADQALYRAKREGRNRVVIAH